MPKMRTLGLFKLQTLIELNALHSTVPCIPCFSPGSGTKSLEKGTYRGVTLMCTLDSLAWKYEYQHSNLKKASTVNNGGYWPPPLASIQLSGEVATELASIRLTAFRLT
jgi:hypothetical protein